MYTRILVPVDGSAASARGLDEAIELARPLKARMRLVHVVEPWVMVSPETTAATLHQVAENIRSVGAGLLKECENKVTNAGIKVDVELIETFGDSAGKCIVRKAKEVEADRSDRAGSVSAPSAARLHLMVSPHLVGGRRGPLPSLSAHQPKTAARRTRCWRPGAAL
jgi:hypothetical protein